MKKQILFFIAFVPIILNAQNHKIHGVLIDSINQSPVDYANIGIAGKNLGTVSNDSGYFKLDISDKFLKDSLTFSRIGYATKIISIEKLVRQEDLEIKLIPKSTEIQEARIVSNQLKRKTKGNVSRSKGVLFALYSDTVKLGGETGLFVRLPKSPTLIKDFNFHIIANHADSAKLRFNLYDGKKGMVGENLLKENIYFTLHKSDVGDYKLDLSKHKIFAYDDVFIALEHVAVYVNDAEKLKSKKKPPSIFLSGTLFGSRGLYNEVSMGKWKEFPMTISPGFWITILN